VKRIYRSSNHREHTKYTCLSYNRLLVSDILGKDEKRAEPRRRGQEEAASHEQEVVQSALQAARSTKENAMSSALFQVKVRVFDFSNRVAQELAVAESPKEVHKDLREMLEVEGMEQLLVQVGVFLYRDANNGADPPRGDARMAARLPRPRRGNVFVHRALAVAAGQSMEPWAKVRTSYTDATCVRARPSFFGAPWFSDVEIAGSDGTAWYGRVLALLRYQMLHCLRAFNCSTSQRCQYMETDAR
jgi:hypothetical protein